MLSEIASGTEKPSGSKALVSEAPNGKRDKDGGAKGSTKKKQRLSKQEEFKNCMEQYTKYQKESDDKFLEEMKQQAKVETKLRKEELKAYTDSMALMANAISSRHQQAVDQPSNQFFFEDERNNKTYYKL